jgi:hypothetical protein
VKLMLQTRILPDTDQSRKLSATMRAFNAAADWLAGEAAKPTAATNPYALASGNTPASLMTSA